MSSHDYRAVETGVDPAARSQVSALAEELRNLRESTSREAMSLRLALFDANTASLAAIAVLLILDCVLLALVVRGA